MSIFRRDNEGRGTPTAPRFPRIGERVTIREQGAACVWSAKVQNVAPGLLNLEFDPIAHPECRETIPAGRMVRIDGLHDAAVRLSGQSRGRNGVMVGVRDVALAEHAAPEFVRLPAGGALWCTTNTDPSGSLIDVMGLSLAALAMRAWDGVRAGHVVGMADPSDTDPPLARGLVVDVSFEGSGVSVAHVAFLVGTPTDAVASLTHCLAQQQAFGHRGTATGATPVRSGEPALSY